MAPDSERGPWGCQGSYRSSCQWGKLTLRSLVSPSCVCSHPMLQKSPACAQGLETHPWTEYLEIPTYNLVEGTLHTQ